MLRKLLLEVDMEQSVTQVCKGLNLKDCCYTLAKCWDYINETNLSRASRKLWPVEEEDNNAPVEKEHTTSDTFVAALQEISGCSDATVDDVDQWLNVDGEDAGYHIFNDEESVEQLVGDDT